MIVCNINSIIFYDKYINKDTDSVFFKRNLST